jgi:hypothetical protein
MRGTYVPVLGEERHGVGFPCKGGAAIGFETHGYLLS